MYLFLYFHKEVDVVHYRDTFYSDSKLKTKL